MSKIRFYIIYQDRLNNEYEAWIDAKDQGDLRRKFNALSERGMVLLKAGVLSEMKGKSIENVKQFGKAEDNLWLN